jgi:hypothetical protein
MQLGLHVGRLAGLGFSAAHARVIDVSSLRPLEIVGECVVPAVTHL